MPQLNKVLIVEDGSNLMQALTQKQVPVASSCRGDGICGKCVIQVKNGLKNLSTVTDLESKIKQKHFLKSNERLSCQCLVLGNIEITTKYW